VFESLARNKCVKEAVPPDSDNDDVEDVELVIVSDGGNVFDCDGIDEGDVDMLTETVPVFDKGNFDPESETLTDALGVRPSESEYVTEFVSERVVESDMDGDPLKVRVFDGDTENELLRACVNDKLSLSDSSEVSLTDGDRVVESESVIESSKD